MLPTLGKFVRVMRGIFICAFAFCFFIVNSSQHKSHRCEASPSCMCFSTQHSFRTERMSHGSVCSLSLVARCRTVKRSLDPGRSSNSAAPNSQELGAGGQRSQRKTYNNLKRIHCILSTWHGSCEYEFGGQGFHGPRWRASSNTSCEFSCSGGAVSRQRIGDDDDLGPSTPLPRLGVGCGLSFGFSLSLLLGASVPFGLDAGL